MSFWKPSGKNNRTIDNFALSTSQNRGNAATEEFYELELGVILDIVLDDKHPVFSPKSSVHSTIDVSRWPEDLEGKMSADTDKDLTWIGRALVRPLNSQTTTEKDKLVWAFPLESNISEYPVLNELVVLVRY